MIRTAERRDAARIAEIYSFYVEETAISFEYEAPDADEMARRMAEFGKEYPYIVYEEDGRILGYAYAHRFLPREAYRHCVEMTIYLDREECGKGLGRALYAEMEKRLKAQGITNLYAIIMHPGSGSVEFHERMGYRIVGRLTDCGEKFGRLWSVVYMEKII